MYGCTDMGLPPTTRSQNSSRLRQRGYGLSMCMHNTHTRAHRRGRMVGGRSHAAKRIQPSGHRPPRSGRAHSALLEKNGVARTPNPPLFLGRFGVKRADFFSAQRAKGSGGSGALVEAPTPNTQVRARPTPRSGSGLNTQHPGLGQASTPNTQVWAEPQHPMLHPTATPASPSGAEYVYLLFL